VLCPNLRDFARVASFEGLVRVVQPALRGGLAYSEDGKISGKPALSLKNRGEITSFFVISRKFNSVYVTFLAARNAIDQISSSAMLHPNLSWVKCRITWSIADFTQSASCLVISNKQLWLNNGQRASTVIQNWCTCCGQCYGTVLHRAIALIGMLHKPSRQLIPAYEETIRECGLSILNFFFFGIFSARRKSISKFRALLKDPFVEQSASNHFRPRVSSNPSDNSTLPL
jgi:hypothetical protein